MTDQASQPKTGDANGSQSTRDPAVEAAQRAGAFDQREFARPGIVPSMTAAAREALKPIRELHYPVDTDWGPVCATCWGPNGRRAWPCDTAKLIYTTEELKNV